MVVSYFPDRHKAGDKMFRTLVVSVWKAAREVASTDVGEHNTTAAYRHIDYMSLFRNMTEHYFLTFNFWSAFVCVLHNQYVGNSTAVI